MSVPIEIKNAYLILQKASGIKSGDRVNCLRIAKDGELGWNNVWVEEMDERVGKTLTVTGVSSAGVSLYGCSYCFPFFVLEILPPPCMNVKLNESHSAVVSSKGIVVGCQTFPLSIIDDLVKARDAVILAEKS